MKWNMGALVVSQSADEALMAADEPVLIVIDFKEK